MIRRLRQNINEYRLKKKLQGNYRKVQTVNLADARSIAILADITSAEDFEIIKSLVNDFKTQGKKVFCIGFYNQKYDCNYSYPKSEFDIYTAKQLKGNGMPDSPYLETFLSEKRDLLIDLNLKNHFFLRYLAALSNASFKCGLHSPSNEIIHDLLISIPEDSTIKDFIKAAKSVLERIHPSSTK